MNDRILDMYLQFVVPKICDPGDDSNYGSSATKDVEVLQLISRRIHFGKFVAEAKYNDPILHHQYVQLINAKDKEGILQLLTDAVVEEKLLKRVRRKTTAYGKDYTDSDKENEPLKISSEVIVEIYKDFIIPLTKQVEVEYLLIRNQVQQSMLDSSLCHLTSV
jgi:chorismate mutase